MSPQQLLARLKQSGTIDAATLGKIEAHMAASQKKVTLKAIVRYLLEKKKITREQAAELLLDGESQLEMAQTPAAGQRAGRPSFDTDDLANLAPPPAPSPPPTPAKRAAAEAGKTLSDVPREVEDFQVVDRPLRVDSADLEPLTYSQGFVTGEDFASATPETHSASFEGKREEADQWQSKWLFIGFGLVGALIFVTIFLAWLLSRTTADQAFREAEEHFAGLRYQAAREKYESFCKDFPQDKKIPLARVRIVNAMLRGFYNAKNWRETLAVAKDKLPEVAATSESAMSELYGELSVILPGAALGFSDQAVNAKTTEEKQAFMAQAEDAYALVVNASYVPVSSLKAGAAQEALAQYQENMDKVRFEIERETTYTSTLASIEQLTGEAKTDAAAAAYFELVQRYPLLKTRQPLLDAILKISAKEGELIQPAPFELVAETVDRARPTSATVLQATVGTPRAELAGRVLVFPVHGNLYGLAADSGTILWWRPIGWTTRIPPQWVAEPQTSDLIVCDAQRHEVQRLRYTDGTLVWRTAIAEPFVRPAVAHGHVFVTTRQGRMIRLDLHSGQADASCQLPQPVTVGAIPHPDVSILYQLGRQSNLYMISAEDLSCREVYYLGHAPDTIDVEPFLISGNLCVLQNFAQHCRVHVVGFKDRGTSAFEAQPSFKVTDGKVMQDVERYGRSVVFISETGDVRMYELNVSLEGDESIIQLQPLITGTYQTYPEVGNFFAAAGGDLFLANRGLTKYRIKKAQQAFDLRKTSDTADTFLGPITVFDNTVAHLRRRLRSLQVSAALVDRETLEEVWRTDFGAPPVAGLLTLGEQPVAISSQGDLFAVDLAMFDQVAANPLTRGTPVNQTLRFDVAVPLADGSWALCGLDDAERVLHYQPGNPPVNKLSLLAAPANQIAAEPVAIGSQLLVPASGGQICRVDPQSGSIVGTPFQPAINPNRPIRWVRPTLLASGDRFVAATTNGSFYLIDARDERSLVKLGELEYASNVVSPLLASPDRVYAVCRDASHDKLVAFAFEPQLSESKSAILPESFTGAFYRVGESLFLATADRRLRAFDLELNPRWDAALPAVLAGTPWLSGEGLWLALDDGQLVRLNPATGELLSTVTTEVPLAGAPTLWNGRWLLSDQNGLLHAMPAPQ